MADRPILFDKPFPETQVSGPSYQQYFNKIMGTVFVTAGFMEPSGHGFKSSARKAIRRDGSMITVGPGRYNIGFDYSKGFGTPVTCMYSGVVTKAGREGGYGNRIHIQLDMPFVYQGKTYTCYQAYAHCSKLLKTVAQKVAQGETIAIEAGHGSNGPRDYGSHVDLDTYCMIKGEKIHLNFELLAGGVESDDIIEKIEVMKVGSRGLDVRWLQQKLNITADGTFGKNTKKAVEDYQRSQPDLAADGIAGEKTCIKLGLSNYAIFPKEATVIKSQPIQSAEITDPQGKFDFVPKTDLEPLLATWVQDEGDYWKFELKTPQNGKYNWCGFKAHIEIVKGYEEDFSEDDDSHLGDLDQSSVDESTKASGNLTRWEKALKNYPTEGCKKATSDPEGISQPGVATSHEIARRDMKHLNEQRLSSIKKAAQKLNIPTSIAIAIGSRESHLGSILGKFGNKPGWGDNNHAFGICQVDKRFHTLVGLDDPYSQAHVEQAMGILSRYRDQVEKNHPSWTDEQVLKGACVAYNAGVSNVRTISGMNQGTTHDDYGDDVIARAQFYLQNLKLLAAT